MANDRWNCVDCGESIDSDLEVCWNCGSTQRGVKDPSFTVADDFGPEDAEPLPPIDSSVFRLRKGDIAGKELKPQFRLRHLLILITVFCVVLALHEVWNRPIRRDCEALRELYRFGAGPRWHWNRVSHLRFYRTGEQMTDGHMRFVVELKGLTSLNLYNTNITAKSLPMLKRLNNLEYVELPGNRFRDDDLVAAWRNKWPFEVFFVEDVNGSWHSSERFPPSAEE